MIDRGNYYTCSHCFDTNGAIHAAGDPFFEIGPQPMKIQLEDTRCVDLFVANNPWRAASEEDNSMLYQFCIFCKDQKFENEAFNGSIDDFQKVKSILTNERRARYTCQKAVCFAKWHNVAENLSEEMYHAIFSVQTTIRLKSFTNSKN